MAVRRANKLSEVPEGAILMSSDEAIQYQWTQIKTWPKFSDVWPFRIGIPTLGTAACVSGLIVNNHFRKKLKLRRYGLLSTNFAMGLTPAIIVAASHTIFATHEIFLNGSQCGICIQQRAVFLQVAFGVLYPMTLSPIANSMYATRHGTYRLPHYSEFSETIKLWWKWAKQGKLKFFCIILAESLIAGFFTWKEQMALLSIKTQLALADDEFSDEKAEKVVPLSNYKDK